MATITTKYSVGDVVYHASTVQTRKQHPCPDCNGTRKWKAQSPAGGEFEFACPRCSASYQSDRDLSLDYTAYAPIAGKLTIGSIQVNTAPGSYDHGNRYMCIETGVGSGSIYDEARLFETEDAALKAARVMADEQNAKTEWIITLYNRTLSLSDYQIESVKVKAAEEAKSRAHSMIWNIGYLFGEIREADGKEAIIELVDWYGDHDWSRDKEKFALAFPGARFAPTLIDAMSVARAVIQEDRDALFESVTVAGAESSIDEMDRPHLARLDAALAAIDAALTTEGK